MDIKLLRSWFAILLITKYPVCQGYVYTISDSNEYASYRCKVKFDWTIRDSSICFLFPNSTRMSHSSSLKYCSSLHPDMHLPIIKDRSTLKFVTDRLEAAGIKESFWLGAKREAQGYEKQILWVDGTELPHASKLWQAPAPNKTGRCVAVSQKTDVENDITYRTLDNSLCNKNKLAVCSCQTVKGEALNGTDELFSGSPSLNSFKDSYTSSVEDGGDPLIELDRVGFLAAKKLLDSSEPEVNESVQTESFRLELKKFEVSSFTGGTFSSPKKDATIEVQKSILQSGYKNSSKYAATVGISYSTEKTAVKFKNESSWQLNSDVISYSVVYDYLNFTKPVVLAFSHKAQSNGHENTACAFWNTKTNSWAQDGCYKVKSNSTMIICHCYHLTVFASLMQVVPDSEIDQFSESESFAIGITTYTCFSLSYVGLFITIAAHSSKKLLSKECYFIRMNLCIAILLAQTVYLAGIDRTNHQAACKFLAFLLHYVYLAVGCWMLSEGISIARMTTRIVPANDSRLKFCLLGWGFPVVLVGACFAALHKSYGNKKSCFLAIEDGTIWAFAGPMLLIIMINVCVLVVAVKATLGVRINRKKSDKERIKVGIKALFVLMPLLGLTWITGLFAIGAASKPMQILFSVFNSLQGFFIFIFHFMKNSEIRKTSLAKISFGRCSVITNNKVFSSPAMTRLQIKTSARQTSSLRTPTAFSVAADDVIM